jgi:hypothetical protein
MTHFGEASREEFKKLTEALATAGADDLKWGEALESSPYVLAGYFDCSDILPEHNCRLLHMPLGSTYGQTAKDIYRLTNSRHLEV